MFNFRQNDIEEMVQTWNLHVIRPSKNQNCPSGRPAVMYMAPNLYGTHSYLHTVGEAEIETCKDKCEFREQYPCDRDLFELALIIMQEENWDIPIDVNNALQLYCDLRSKILQEL